MFDLRTLQKATQRDMDAWNCGDLVGFCASYTEDATMVSNGGVHQGRDDILAFHRKIFQDGDDLGQLTLTIDRCGSTSPEATIVGWAMLRWTLTRGGKTATGFATVTFKIVEGELKVYQDLSFTT
ncbi:MAG: hypothetical protein RL141_254 [Candidatus Parcubacteria bacterium]|jgi:uncharacterized protein (TIGR02246 family)